MAASKRNLLYNFRSDPEFRAYLARHIRASRKAIRESQEKSWASMVDLHRTLLLGYLLVGGLKPLPPKWTYETKRVRDRDNSGERKPDSVHVVS